MVTIPLDLSYLGIDFVDARKLSFFEGDFDLFKLVVDEVSLLVYSLFLFTEFDGLTFCYGLALLGSLAVFAGAT